MNCPICKKPYLTVEQTNDCLFNHPIKELMNFEPQSQANVILYLNMQKAQKTKPRLDK